MDEVDPRTGGAAAGQVVEQPDPPLPQDVRHGVDVVDSVCELLDAGPTAVEEPSDSRVRGQRREQLQLDGRRVVAHLQHRLAHPHLLVDLLVDGLHAENPGVPGDRVVEVGDGDADVVDGREQRGHAGQIKGGCHPAGPVHNTAETGVRCLPPPGGLVSGTGRLKRRTGGVRHPDEGDHGQGTEHVDHPRDARERAVYLRRVAHRRVHNGGARLRPRPGRTARPSARGGAEPATSQNARAGQADRAAAPGAGAGHHLVARGRATVLLRARRADRAPAPARRGAGD